MHTPETEEYGISSFVFRSHIPFHPDRFWKFIQQQWPGNVIRSKGIFWLASRPDNALLWSQAGGSTQAEVYGKWWASVPQAQREKSSAFAQDKKHILKKWDDQWGDRLNELVIIGTHLDKELVTAQLSACQLTEEEIFRHRAGTPFLDAWPL